MQSELSEECGAVFFYSNPPRCSCLCPLAVLTRIIILQSARDVGIRSGSGRGSEISPGDLRGSERGNREGWHRRRDAASVPKSEPPGERRATNEPLETSSSCAAHLQGRNRVLLRIAASFVPGLLQAISHPAGGGAPGTAGPRLARRERGRDVENINIKLPVAWLRTAIY